MNERILEPSPGLMFSSINFILSYMAAESESLLLSVSLTKECWAYSMSVVLLFGMNLSAPWDLFPLYCPALLMFPRPEAE